MCVCVHLVWSEFLVAMHFKNSSTYPFSINLAKQLAFTSTTAIGVGKSEIERWDDLFKTNENLDLFKDESLGWSCGGYEQLSPFAHVFKTRE